MSIRTFYDESYPGELWTAPVLTSLAPNTMESGGQRELMIVKGTGFTKASRIIFAGVEEVTDYVSSTDIRTYVTGSLFAPGTQPVSVRNGSGLSNELTFTFTEVTVPGAPVLTGVIPTSAPITAHLNTFIVQGTGFQTGAEIWLDAAPIPTTLISATNITARDPIDPPGTPGVVSVHARIGQGVFSNELSFTWTA